MFIIHYRQTIPVFNFFFNTIKEILPLNLKINDKIVNLYPKFEPYLVNSSKKILINFISIFSKQQFNSKYKSIFRQKYKEYYLMIRIQQYEFEIFVFIPSIFNLDQKNYKNLNNIYQYIGKQVNKKFKQKFTKLMFYNKGYGQDNIEVQAFKIKSLLENTIEKYYLKKYQEIKNELHFLNLQSLQQQQILYNIINKTIRLIDLYSAINFYQQMIPLFINIYDLCQNHLSKQEQDQWIKNGYMSPIEPIPYQFTFIQICKSQKQQFKLFQNIFSRLIFYLTKINKIGISYYYINQFIKKIIKRVDYKDNMQWNIYIFEMSLIYKQYVETNVKKQFAQRDIQEQIIFYKTWVKITILIGTYLINSKFISQQIYPIKTNLFQFIELITKQNGKEMPQMKVENLTLQTTMKTRQILYNIQNFIKYYFGLLNKLQDLYAQNKKMRQSIFYNFLQIKLFNENFQFLKDESLNILEYKQLKGWQQLKYTYSIMKCSYYFQKKMFHQFFLQIDQLFQYKFLKQNQFKKLVQVINKKFNNQKISLKTSYIGIMKSMKLQNINKSSIFLIQISITKYFEFDFQNFTLELIFESQRNSYQMNLQQNQPFINTQGNTIILKKQIEIQHFGKYKFKRAKLFMNNLLFPLAIQKHLFYQEFNFQQISLNISEIETLYTILYLPFKIKLEAVNFFQILKLNISSSNLYIHDLIQIIKGDQSQQVIYNKQQIQIPIQNHKCITILLYIKSIKLKKTKIEISVYVEKEWNNQVISERLYNTRVYFTSQLLDIRVIRKNYLYYFSIQNKSPQDIYLKSDQNSTLLKHGEVFNTKQLIFQIFTQNQPVSIINLKQLSLIQNDQDEFFSLWLNQKDLHFKKEVPIYSEIEGNIYIKTYQGVEIIGNSQGRTEKNKQDKLNSSLIFTRKGKIILPQIRINNKYGIWKNGNSIFVQ